VVSRALVLGAGGVTGVAWELGVLRGLEAGGVPVGDVDLVVGTSAGSLVGAQLTSRVALEELFRAQLEPPDPRVDRAVDFDWERIGTAWLQLAQSAVDARDFRARIGAMARQAPTAPEAERIEVIVSRLTVADWPELPLLITAVDTASGEFVVFDRNAGVPLPLAVAASCAVPLVWPPVTIGGRRYMDGGMRSPTNVDLARDHDAVLVVAPLASPGMGPLMPGLDSELARLPPGGRVVVILPDEAAMAAIGPNMLDPALRAGAARAGLAQGERAVGQARALWSARPDAPPAAS
jgi:NTE family protein